MKRQKNQAEKSKASHGGLLTRKQVAQCIQSCVRTVERIPAELLPPIRFNPRLIRYRPEDVEHFIHAAMTGKKEEQ